MAEAGLGLRRFAADSAFNAGRQVLGIALGLVTSVLLARGLGSEGRGVYALALLLSTLLVALLSLGIGPATVFLVSRESSGLERIVRGNSALALWLSLGICLAGGAIVVLFGTLLFPGVPRALLLTSLLVIPIEMQVAPLQSTLQGLQDFRRFNSVDVLRMLTLLGLIGVLVWGLDRGPTGALLANIGSALAAWLAAAWFVGRRVGARALFGIRLDRAHARRILGFGSRVHVSNVVAFLNYRADLFLLNLMSGVGLVGVYSVSVALAERLWIVSRSVGTVMLPRIASLELEEQDRRRLTPIVARHVLWLSVAVALPAFLLAEPFIRLLYGEDFAAAALGLQILLPGIVLLSLSRIVSADIAGRGHPEINARRSVLGFAVNLAANVLLIPRWGIAGVSLATCLSYAVITLTGLFDYRRLTGVGLSEVLLPRREDLVLWRQAARLARARMRRPKPA